MHTKTGVNRKMKKPNLGRKRSKSRGGRACLMMEVVEGATLAQEDQEKWWDIVQQEHLAPKIVADISIQTTKEIKFRHKVVKPICLHTVLTKTWKASKHQLARKDQKLLEKADNYLQSKKSSNLMNINHLVTKICKFSHKMLRVISTAKLQGQVKTISIKTRT